MQKEKRERETGNGDYRLVCWSPEAKALDMAAKDIPGLATIKSGGKETNFVSHLEASRAQQVTTASLPGLGFANIRVKRKVRL